MKNKLLKFRIWDSGDKQWVLGPCEFLQLDKIFHLNESLPDWTFQQFTGLLDEDGKEIYEGDIISIHRKDKKAYEKAEIIWSQEYLTWLVKVWYGKEYWSENLSSLVNTDQDFEVIGNIFENSILLNNI